MNIRRLAAGALAACVALTAIGAAPAQQQGRAQSQQQQSPQQNVAQGAQAGQAGRLGAIRPFVTTNTVAVAHADLSKLDPQAIDQWMRGMVQRAETDPAKREEHLRQADESMKQMRDWVNGMKQAGARDVYALMNFGGDAAQQGQPAPVVVVPLGQGANAEQVARLLTPPQQAQGQDAQSRPQTAVIRDAVVLGTQPAIQALQQQQQGAGGAAAAAGNAPPGLDEALSSTGGSVAQVVFIPNEPVKAMLQQLAQQFAGGAQPQGANGQAGGLQNVPQTMRWLALGVDAPPQVAVRAVVRATDAQGAQRIADEINRGLAQLRNSNQQAQAASQMLAPQVQGDRVTVSLSSEQINQLVQQVAKAQGGPGGGPGAGGGQGAAPAGSRQPAGAGGSR